MIPELGHFALIIGLAFALCLSVVPLIGVAQNNHQLINSAKPLSFGLFFFVAISISLLGYSFTVDDFSVKYIAGHSNSLLPYYFKISAVWGGHEGSMLLWVFALTCWTFAVSIFSKQLEKEFVARVLAVMGMIAVGFILFTLLTSNPFERLLPNFPLEGLDLNPLLQDIGLIIHPPMLYMGYVGFSVAFAFAIAALMAGKMDAAWARWSRPWTVAAWSFLSVGIALGSWWAYYELGWGGWWFWDPVENASFLPWLAGTALIHALAVTEQRNTFKHWTLLLAIFTFSLVLLGAFLVRSGVITSVHSFAVDPERGIYLLVLLAIAVGGSLTLYAIRAANVSSPNRFTFYSRENAILIAMSILVTATVTILLGTLYPLIIDAMGLGKISVGAPYFNAVFVPMMIALFLFMGVGPLTRWKKARKGELAKHLNKTSIFSVFFGAAWPFIYAGEFSLSAFIGMTLGCWIVLAVLKDVFINAKQADGSLKFSAVPLNHIGMALAHAGIAITVIGVTMVSTYEKEMNVKMAPGESANLSGYMIEFVGTKDVLGPNYSAIQGQLKVSLDGEFVTLLKPEQRTYKVQRTGMTEAAIHTNLWRDIYVALGDPLEQNSWSMRLYYKPFIIWIWLGGFCMAIGGFLAILSKRYRKRVLVTEQKLTQAKPVVLQEA
ncbi:heme lyase CcmF/NrfE family subunit [Colwellia sp. MB3u-70]|uniref:heme lyase CcmF/NrfE family subunit n=1 Tax=unclassified Colwellia TaxID=196834 RepID=UPI0015F74199|nr:MULTISPECIES: heme lyase CcmF/NrfE family subunit [unclassified Colwellia]MBA6292042.1 heme lyase CcmF/NrfE family subunit [Colwellia sp. MB3u-8]MBA6309025.1 heme lyase CcmF/NrfE family subunit [Colwellia sp. MB3u-70]